jgi:hypothetical protein
LYPKQTGQFYEANLSVSKLSKLFRAGISKKKLAGGGHHGHRRRKRRGNVPGGDHDYWTSYPTVIVSNKVLDVALSTARSRRSSII